MNCHRSFPKRIAKLKNLHYNSWTALGPFQAKPLHFRHNAKTPNILITNTHKFFKIEFATLRIIHYFPTRQHFLIEYLTTRQYFPIHYLLTPRDFIIHEISSPHYFTINNNAPIFSNTLYNNTSIISYTIYNNTHTIFYNNYITAQNNFTIHFLAKLIM